RELAHRERPSLKQTIIGDELAKPRVAAQPRAGQRHMRLELLRFGRDARAHHSRFDLIAQVKERRLPLDANPDRAHAIVVAEQVYAAQLQLKAGGAYGRKREVDILETRFVPFSDKAQGDVQVLRLDPARVGQAAAELGNAILN